MVTRYINVSALSCVKSKPGGLLSSLSKVVVCQVHYPRWGYISEAMAYSSVFSVLFYN